MRQEYMSGGVDMMAANLKTSLTALMTPLKMKETAQSLATAAKEANTEMSKMLDTKAAIDKIPSGFPIIPVALAGVAGIALIFLLRRKK